MRYDTVTTAIVTAEIIVTKRTVLSNISGKFSDDLSALITTLAKTNIRAPVMNIHIRPFSTPNITSNRVSETNYVLYYSHTYILPFHNLFY